MQLGFDNAHASVLVAETAERDLLSCSFKICKQNREYSWIIKFTENQYLHSIAVSTVGYKETQPSLRNRAKHFV